MITKTATDIVNEYEQKNIPATSVNTLKIAEKVSTMTICTLTNIFNLMSGTYYNEKVDTILLKSQTSSENYNDK